VCVYNIYIYIYIYILRVFDNRMMRRIIGPKRDKVTRECRKLHNETLNYTYCSPNTIRVIKSRIEMGGACNAYGGEETRVQGYGRDT